VNRAGRFDFETNPFNNKATAYLGGESRNLANATQQFDAGLQFETGVFGNFTRGWTGLFSRGNVFVTAHVWNGTADVAWRPPATAPGWSIVTDPTSGKFTHAAGSISTGMAFTMAPGGASTVVLSAIGRGNNTFFWNPNGNNDATDLRTIATAAHPVAPWGSNAYNHANQAAATVKRVSGMTRSPNWLDELDGSGMSAVWSECEVNGGSWIGLVDQSVTGYDSEANNELAWDRRVAGVRTRASRTTTEFSGAGLTNGAARSGVDQPARYDGETVTMNLGTAATLGGEAVEWE
jgi:hypothetical protein